MKQILSNVRKNSHFLYCFLVAVMVHIIPIAGIFMNGMWYKYPYIIGSYAIGLIFFLKTHGWYLKNSTERHSALRLGEIRSTRLSTSTDAK
jgi:hypothetical protein